MKPVSKEQAIREALTYASFSKLRQLIVSRDGGFIVKPISTRAKDDDVFAVVWPDGGIDCQTTNLRGTQLQQYERGDCGVVAISVACRVSYDKAHAALRRAGRADRCVDLPIDPRLPNPEQAAATLAKTLADEIPDDRDAGEALAEARRVHRQRFRSLAWNRRRQSPRLVERNSEADSKDLADRVTFDKMNEG